LIFDGDLDHGAEIGVVFAADADVAGIDSVFRERLGAGGIFFQEQVAVVVEVSDDGDVDVLIGQLFDDVRDGGGSVFVIDGDADEFGSGAGEGGDLADGYLLK